MAGAGLRNPAAGRDFVRCHPALPAGHARVGALLTPQGKILFEFLLSRQDADRFFIELPRDQWAAFIQRMTLYRLRAKVDIEPVEDLAVSACWDCRREDGYLADERFRDGADVFRVYGAAPAQDAQAEDYARLRIRYGVSRGGQRLRSVRRLSPRRADGPQWRGVPEQGLLCRSGSGLAHATSRHGPPAASSRWRPTTPCPVTAMRSNPAAAASVNSETVVGQQGLALVRIDRVAKAMAGDSAITTQGRPVRLRLPAWTGLQFPAVEDAG